MNATRDARRDCRIVVNGAAFLARAKVFARRRERHANRQALAVERESFVPRVIRVTGWDVA